MNTENNNNTMTITSGSAQFSDVVKQLLDIWQKNPTYAPIKVSCTFEWQNPAVIPLSKNDKDMKEILAKKWANK